MVSTESLYPFQVDVCNQVLIVAFKDGIGPMPKITFAWMPRPSKISIHDIAKTFYVLYYVKNVANAVLVDHNCCHGRLATT